MGNPILVVVAGDSQWQFDADVVRAAVEPLGLSVSDSTSVGEITVLGTNVGVRADRSSTAEAVARLRALAPAEVTLLCFDEAYTRPELELVPGVGADEVARLLYEGSGGQREE